ncbi:hypothetical protein CYFUS_008244 [Cystobacter fuscus]|uniref:Cytochrome oxidase complex assembly protein 1 n=1 Tax=Cystobacter fuscus TaxID=43 RepID=A0A250JFT6_9BACT|nr:cytochrome c oxidase assembly factor Coa1 family protein [Cystobacter fuscus]ATB42765.1 hypothetical protein CYFUS_008244 [Cystobacter fuscus]
MSTTSEGPITPQKSWFGRNWAWFIPMGCLGLLLSCGCLGALIAGLTFKSLRDNNVVTEALARTRQSPEAREVLGEPIEADWKVQGSFSTTNGQGSAQLAIPVRGPKAEGTLHVEAYKRDSDTWTFTTLELDVPDHPELNLLGDAPSAPPGTIPARPDLPDVEPLPDEEEMQEEPPASDDKDVEL